uniref:Immunoglobulin V-set domain-containing protein n=1 Tax=Echeneis naucrates TaxID=173247 RepID=A0A665V506_ECHNA
VLIHLFLCMFCSSSECKGEDRVIQRPEDVTAAEGDTVTLDSNSFPQYMLRCYAKNVDKAPELDQKRFHAEIKNKSVPLKIQKLQVSDSAVYYCEQKCWRK